MAIVFKNSPKFLDSYSDMTKPADVAQKPTRAISRQVAAVQKRSYAAAAVSNLLSDWQTNNNAQDIESRLAIRQIRNRARASERDNDYVRKFFRDLESNVIGHQGFKLSMKLKTTRGKLNRTLNEQIETAYAKWRQRGNYDVTGRLSGLDGDKLILRSVARDGDTLIRLIRGYDGNDCRFAFQHIEADQLDENYVWNLNPTTYIRMGVEMDEWRRPTGYHLWKQHPGDLFPELVRIRIPADQIIHPFITERVGQSRGISWLASSMVRLRHLAMYEEAEVIAARASAGKMGFFERTGEQEYVGDGVDDNGNIINEVTPGTLENLPIGVSFKPYNPEHPNGNYPEFRKGVLRGVACGLGVLYNTAFGDLESVNYSSLRGGELDERDAWLGLQEWFISSVKRPEITEWAKMAILTNTIKGFSIDDAEEIADCAHWRGRRWSWVDPLKDVQANIMAVNAGLDSKTNVIESMGRTVEEVFEELAAEQELAKEKGLVFLQDLKNPMDSGKQPQDPNDDTQVDITDKPTPSNGKS